MKPEKPKKLGFRKIYYNLDKILFLFFLIFMMVEFVWLPLNSWIAGILLRQTGYLFISYNNFWAIINIKKNRNSIDVYKRQVLYIDKLWFCQLINLINHSLSLSQSCFLRFSSLLQL